MSNLPDSEVDRHDASKSSKKLKMILLGLFLLCLTTGVVLFALRESTDSKERLEKIKQEKAQLALDAPTAIDEILTELHNIKADLDLGSSKLTDDMVDNIQQAKEAVKKLKAEREALKANTPSS